jgi:hypothetical protein
MNFSSMTALLDKEGDEDEFWKEHKGLSEMLPISFFLIL